MPARNERVFDRHLAVGAAPQHDLGSRKLELLQQESDAIFRHDPLINDGHLMMPAAAVPRKTKADSLHAETDVMALASSWVTPRASRVLGSLLVREQIETLIREVLSPLFEADGASLELVDIVDKVVRIRVGGSYRGCPSVPYTLEGVVIPALRRAAGTDVQVELVH